MPAVGRVKRRRRCRPRSQDMPSGFPWLQAAFTALARPAVPSAANSTGVRLSQPGVHAVADQRAQHLFETRLHATPRLALRSDHEPSSRRSSVHARTVRVPVLSPAVTPAALGFRSTFRCASGPAASVPSDSARPVWRGCWHRGGRRSKLHSSCLQWAGCHPAANGWLAASVTWPPPERQHVRSTKSPWAIGLRPSRTSFVAGPVLR